MAETKKVTKKETTKLNPMVWDIPYNGDLIAQVLYVFASNERKGTSSVKGKGDVSGGGKKPWKQKGTGRARSGSIRSPLWVGGGVTFGPNNRNWKRSINKKMVQKALCMMLSLRNREELVKFVNIDSEKELKDLRVSIDKEVSKKSLLISGSEKASLALRNVKTFKVVTPMGVNLKDIVAARNILVDMEGLNILEKRLTNGK
ncbi:50S ribosomal protein L4 [candidate division WS6 bacterium RIFOXYB1_FULL_33_14]|uniref:Large ribosomal subunit protein uL4 n=2 Tax=Candidatus Dojkabacteria TaxID=74243 RepID=A0A1F4UIB1_9BACT|nr:ribosomal protein L4 [uncultured bacterium]OGC44701.1 MAG: 50S ribosomal protein L4 [candidate division WS6 bacterium RIFOXYB1_FULL_33_14]